MNPHLILPIGTQVVSRVERASSDGQIICPKGAVGRIVHAPTDNSHTYQVELPDGQQVGLHRHELSIRKDYQQVEQSDFLADYELRDYIIYRCIVGSRAYGLDDEHSDTDRRGIYLPPDPA